MTRSTTAPATLAEYQEHVRKEALKIQVDMGWPDDKLNAALRALGLPEKVTYYVPVEVTGRMLAVIRVDDTQTEEEAREQVASKTPEELRTLLGRTTQLGSFDGLVSTVMEAMPTTFAVGDLDTTYSNGSVANAHGGNIRWCEQYDRTSAHYCTREKGHQGMHAQGNGRTVIAAWDA